MTKTWLVSDTHFSHVNICKFTNADGLPLRPWDDPEEMDEALVKNWNAVVQPQDRVYHLGDVVINRRALSILSRLNGRLKLIKGNHDIFKLSDYTPYFDDICAYVVKKTPQGGKCILSHIPVHPESLGRFGLNIHGHLHSNIVMRDDVPVQKEDGPGGCYGTRTFYRKGPDLRYVNVSVEQTNYTPILLEDAIARGVPEEITEHK